MRLLLWAGALFGGAGATCGPCDVSGSLNILTDVKPSETSWKITMVDPTGCANDASATGGAFVVPEVAHKVRVDGLCEGRNYEVEVLDGGSDGLCCAHGQGKVHFEVDGAAVWGPVSGSAEDGTAECGVNF